MGPGGPARVRGAQAEVLTRAGFDAWVLYDMEGKGREGKGYVGMIA